MAPAVLVFQECFLVHDGVLMWRRASWLSGVSLFFFFFLPLSIWISQAGDQI